MTATWIDATPYVNGGVQQRTAPSNLTPAASHSAGIDQLVTYREGIESVTYPLAATVRVIHRCSFADPVSNLKGQRVFDVYVDGLLYIQNLDIFDETKQAGRELVKDIVTNSVGDVTVSFVSHTGLAIINAMELVDGTGVAVSTPVVVTPPVDGGGGGPPPFLATPVSGVDMVTINWTWAGADPAWFTIGRTGLDSSGNPYPASPQQAGSLRTFDMTLLLQQNYTFTVTASTGAVATCIAAPTPPAPFTLSLTPGTLSLTANWVVTGTPPASWSVVLTGGAVPISSGTLSGATRSFTFSGLVNPTLYTATLTAATGTAATATGTPNSGTVNTSSWLSGWGFPGDHSQDTTGAAAVTSWRATAVALISTWADNDGSMNAANFPSISVGGNFQGSHDLAIGGIRTTDSWATGGNGGLDSFWTNMLNGAHSAWGSHPGTLYLRFCHELNGNWYPWSVNTGNLSSAIAGWKRFRALQRSIFPAAKLVLCCNRESVGGLNSYNLINPLVGFFDVLNVDWYDQNPSSPNQAAWDANIVALDASGGPKGIEKWRQLALACGVPLSLGEWGPKADNNNDTGSAFYVHKMHQFFDANKGNGPGNILYESLFNAAGTQNDQWALYPVSRMPLASAQYVTDF